MKEEKQRFWALLILSCCVESHPKDGQFIIYLDCWLFIRKGRIILPPTDYTNKLHVLRNWAKVNTSGFLDILVVPGEISLGV
jgi:hypothetical protein